VRRLLSSLLLAVVVAAALPRAESIALQNAAADSVCGIQTTERVVAVGDVHGALKPFESILRETKIIDNRRRWIGGRAILVQTGDVLDRGPDSRAVIDLLRKLEPEAARAGGRVVALLGNHEVMRMAHDLRYVSKGEYDAFRSFDSVEMRERAYEAMASQERVKPRPDGEKFDERAYRRRFEEATPLGYLEMRVGFAPDGDYGKWVLSRPAVATINGVVFVHGGLSPTVAAMGCDAINAQVRTELAAIKPGDMTLQETLAAGPQGPLWFRGYFLEPLVSGDDLTAALAALGAKSIVVGHTTSDDRRIRLTHDGRVFQIDTGMLAGEYYPNGVPSALELHGGVATAIYVGRREPLR
jgi:hypothetical protein